MVLSFSQDRSWYLATPDYDCWHSRFLGLFLGKARFGSMRFRHRAPPGQPSVSPRLERPLCSHSQTPYLPAPPWLSAYGFTNAPASILCRCCSLPVCVALTFLLKKEITGGEAVHYSEGIIRKSLPTKKRRRRWAGVRLRAKQGRGDGDSRRGRSRKVMRRLPWLAISHAQLWSLKNCLPTLPWWSPDGFPRKDTHDCMKAGECFQ